MALLPLLWLALVRPRSDGSFWWLAAAYAISWLADTAAHWVAPWVISLAYPVTQSVLVSAVLLERRDATRFAICLALIGVAAAFWQGVNGPDLLLRTVAWGSVAVVVYERQALDRLRLALLVSFGLGLLCWMGYAAWPGWTSFAIYQGVRLTGILLFCAAVVHPAPRLRLAVVR